MTCTRCAKRDAVSGYDLCRQCRYYERNDGDDVETLSVCLPGSLADLLRDRVPVGERSGLIARLLREELG